MKQRNFSTELSYILGVVFLAIGTSFTATANFGVSMVVAPSFILYTKLSPILSFVSFGMAEYTVQALLLAVMCLLLRKIKLTYFFAFVTAVLYSLLLDGFMLLLGLAPSFPLWSRIVMFAVGVFITSLGVSFAFHTYIPPGVYELFVKEVSTHFHRNINRFKYCYDAVSCIIALILSFSLFGFPNFVGVNIGTIICAAVNGFLIGMIGKFLEKHFVFVDKLPRLKKFFCGAQTDATSTKDEEQTAQVD